MGHVIQYAWLKSLSVTGLSEEDTSYSESICASRLLLLQPEVIAPSHLSMELTSVSHRPYCKLSRAIINLLFQLQIWSG